MYKTKLQELCQQNHWILPLYSTRKDGPHHNPRFATTVTVNGLSFDTPTPSRSSKESQNEAAKVAFDHLSSPPRPPPVPPTIAPPPRPLAEPPMMAATPKPPVEHLMIAATPKPPAEPPIVAATPKPPAEPPMIAATPKLPTGPASTGESRGCLDMSDILASLRWVQPRLPEECLPPEVKVVEERPIPQVTPPEECYAPRANQSTEIVKDDTPVRDVWHLSKNQLQMYSQKRNLPLPTYSCEREGPPHASRFRCKVTVDGKTFESPGYCSTLKDAEHAVARVALLALTSSGDQERDSGLYKNLLQEFAQKEGYRLPVYDTNGSVGHCPIFTSIVVIEGESFMGQEAKTKKQAEMNAAKVAYTTLIERKQSQTSTSQVPANQGPRVFSPSTSSQLNATPDVPLNIGPRVNAVSSFTNPTKGESVAGEGMEPKSHNDPLPHHGPEISTPRSKYPSLSDTVYGQLKNFTLEESSSESSSSSETGNVPAAADSTIAFPGEAVSIPPRGIVRVYSRALNITLPKGSEIAFSDENWIAVVAGADPN